MSALFLQKSAHHSEDHFKTSRQKEPRPSYIRVLFDKEPGYMLGSPSTKNQSYFKTRPSSSLFQIARGSGATLSECTFFFEKAHVTKKTSSKQTTSRPQDISEFFLVKNPGVYSRTLQQRIEAISRQDPPAPYSK